MKAIMRSKQSTQLMLDKIFETDIALWYTGLGEKEKELIKKVVTKKLYFYGS